MEQGSEIQLEEHISARGKYSGLFLVFGFFFLCSHSALGFLSCILAELLKVMLLLTCLHGLSLILKLQEEGRLSSLMGFTPVLLSFPKPLGSRKIVSGLHDVVICL